jgi:ATP-dependent Clp protease adaptor protein ClpS
MMMLHKRRLHPQTAAGDPHHRDIDPVAAGAAHGAGNQSRLAACAHRPLQFARAVSTATAYNASEKFGEIIMEENPETKEPANKDDKGGTAVKPKRSRRAKPQYKPQNKPPQPLPPWKVLLHNDSKNEMMFVVRTVVELTPLNEQESKVRTLEAHETGVALLLVTHKERAELYQDQFKSKGLTTTIEPAEKS